MAAHNALKKTLGQMAEGSRRAFHSFYLSTAQFVYSSAMLLYGSHADACRFMVDFYQYLYLHIPEYDPSKDLEKWISRLIVERFEQLSIGKNVKTPTAGNNQQASGIQLSKKEIERVWRRLDAEMNFPAEPPRRSPVKGLLLLSLLLLLLLFTAYYLPPVIHQLQQTLPAKTVTDTPDPAEEDTPEDASEEESDTIKDELEQLMDNPASPDTDAADPADEFQVEQHPGITDDTDDTNTPETPGTPQTPDTPQEPQTPKTPDLSGNASSGSDMGDLEDLELQLHYGENLVNAGSH